jgi:hypothetical protein
LLYAKLGAPKNNVQLSTITSPVIPAKAGTQTEFTAPGR